MQLFNAKIIDTKNKKVFGGENSGVYELNQIKYQWALDTYKAMLNCTWFPEEANISRDINDYKSLKPKLKNAFDKTLSQLIFMDSVQTVNISVNIMEHITAPEIANCVSRWSFEESLHSESYRVMLQAITDNPEKIEGLWRTDKQLLTKNQHIAKVYENLANGEVTVKKFALSLIANQILEGIYFNSGFAYIYALAKSGKMLGSAQMIKFINRDENNHLALVVLMLKEIFRENPNLKNEIEDEVVQMFSEATELEISWGKYITQGEILGLTDELIDKYIKYLANDRLKKIGYSNLYLVESNPLTWVKNFSSFNDHKTNFFEGNVINYSKGNLVFEKSWEKIS